MPLRTQFPTTFITRASGQVVNLLDSYFATRVPLLRYRLEETTGTVVQNTGSIGVALNGTLSGTYTQGVQGAALNAGKGIACDGATTNIAFPHHAALSGLSAMTILAVARENSAGESTQGCFIYKLNEWTMRSGGTARIVFERNMTGSGAVNAFAITAANAFIYGNTYAFAARIDTDNVVHLFINGVETSYGTHTTGVGTLAANTNGGGVASVSGGITFDGSILDIAVVEGALSNAAILEHYQAAFLAEATAERAVAFSGTSITQSAPTGYRPLTQDHLVSTYPFVRFTYPQSAYSGSSTWVRLWYMQADLIAALPNTIVYEAVSANYDSAYAAQAKAIEEGAIRRLRAAMPAGRIIVVGMPTYTNNTTPTITNPGQLSFLQALCTQYAMTYVDWPTRVQALLDANTYTLDQLYADFVHPSPTGHAEIAALLEATLTLAFIDGRDAYTGNLADYPAQYDTANTFGNTANYSARNGTNNDGTTGTWTSDGTTLVSSEADATVTWTGTFETFGIDIDLTAGCTIQHNFDNTGWVTDGFLAGGRSINQLSPNFAVRGVHTVQFKVVSGTARIKRFLAI